MKPDIVKTMTEFEWKSAQPNERALHVARACVGVHEEGGNNRGPWVERFLRAVGLVGAYAWCASFVYWCLISAGADLKRLPKKRKAASVLEWVRWAEQEGRIVETPSRCCLFFWLDGSTGHIGWITRSNINGISTIEGNTNDSGSREGDSVADKFRSYKELKRHKRFGYIDLTGIKVAA